MSKLPGPPLKSLVELSREHGLALYMTLGQLCLTCARAWLGDRATGIPELRQALAAYTNQGNNLWVPFFQGQLAEIEAEVESSNIALTSIHQALALAGETGERWSDAFLHRVRGEILLECDPANTGAAEEAFFTAIAIAQQQKGRSFELQAALALAKLYQGTGRAADAHAVLAPALVDFAPTPEFPEIKEALTLLAELAETAQVKNAAASRQRRLKLQASYGQAVMFSQGFASDETKAAFARAQELAAGISNSDERFNAYHGLWAGSLLRGEMRQARETAEIFLREAESKEYPSGSPIPLLL